MTTRVTAIAAAVLAPTVVLIVVLSLSSQAAPLGVPPTVTRVTPNPAINDRDTLLTITGTSFAVVLSGTRVISLPAVSIGTIPLADAGWVSSTTLTATLPTGFPGGLYTVTVTNPDGQSGWLPGGLVVQNPMPSVQAIHPKSSTYGQVAILTITGTSFVATPIVVLDSRPCSAVRYVSSTQLTATVPSDLLPGVYDLTVRNPGPGNPQVRLTRAFTVYSPVPTVTAIDPNSAPNDLDTLVIITGTNFAPTPTVTLGGMSLENVTWKSSTRLTTLARWGMNPGTYNLAVTNPSPGATSATLIKALTVTQGINVWTTGGPYGGTIDPIIINPITPTTFYASASGVGVFRSRDSGENWEQVFADNGGNRVEMDPLSPDRIYSSRVMEGPYRSDDGGNTWMAIPIPGKNAHAYQAFAHPAIAGTVYVAPGGWCAGECSLFKSEDYGQTWMTRTNGLSDTMVNALAFDPTNPLKMYAGTTNGNVFRSINAGESWEFIGLPDLYINQLAVNPFGAHELWACGAGIGHWGYLWKYTSGAWISSSLGTGATAIVFDQHISGTMWVGTEDTFKSTDGGSTWIPFGNPPGPGAIALAVDPTDSQVVYRGFIGRGIYKTTDDGITWQEVNRGLTGIIPHSLAVAPGHPSTVYAATTGAGLYKTTNGGNAWRRLPGAESWDEPVVVDPTTPTRIYYSFDGGVNISEDGGDNWHPAYVQMPPQYAACCQAATLSLIANPGLPGHLVMGVGFVDKSLPYYHLVAGGIYTSIDFGETWSWADVGQVISPVTTLAYDPSNAMAVYAGTGLSGEDVGSGLWKSANGGATWFPSGLSGHAISGIAVDPRDSRTIYVAGFSFYVSHDAGQTWALVTGGVWHNLLLVPTTPPVLYAYDWRGMMRSADYGQHWDVPAGALAHGNIGSMAVATTTDRVIIYVGTSGGMVSGAAQMESQATSDTLVSAGVYRYTTRLLNQRVYLPVILKGYTQ